MIDSAATPDEASLPPMEKERLPHSRWGIASFAIALCAYLMYFLLYCFVAFVIDPPRTPGGSVSLQDGILLIIVSYLGFFSVLCVATVAIIFGIVGLRQPRTRKIYARLGFLLSIVPFLGLAVFSLIAALM